MESWVAEPVQVPGEWPVQKDRGVFLANVPPYESLQLNPL